MALVQGCTLLGGTSFVREVNNPQGDFRTLFDVLVACFSHGAEMLETLRSPPQDLLEANQHGNLVW